jgi:hypothetical protein
MARSRDDFTTVTKSKIASRAGYRCAAPNCRRSTSRPDPIDTSEAINQGVAAHIHAASHGGPRYDPTMSTEQRKAAENGIWLCQNCAKIIDSSENAFPASLLRVWKAMAEEIAARESRSTFDEIGDLINEIDETHQLISRLAHSVRQNEPDLWYLIMESRSDEERRELRRQETTTRNKLHVDMKAAYAELIAPRISAILIRCERVSGPDNQAVKMARLYSLGADTNVLSIESMGEAIVNIRAELLLR